MFDFVQGTCSRIARKKSQIDGIDTRECAPTLAVRLFHRSIRLKGGRRRAMPGSFGTTGLNRSLVKLTGSALPANAPKFVAVNGSDASGRDNWM
jgi:hypothetical protein